jgi:hypothetical protein
MTIEMEAKRIHARHRSSHGRGGRAPTQALT